LASMACVRVGHVHVERCTGVRAHDIARATRRRLVWWSSGMRLCGSVSGEAHACGRVCEIAWLQRSGEIGQGVCRVLQAQ